MKLRTLAATRYVTPLREGGSLPAIVEAEDDGLYVMKFRGAGQGPKVLVAEVIAGLLGKALGFRVPELVALELDAQFHKTEPDDEIRDLLRASVGLNLGMDYLPRSVTFDPAAGAAPDAKRASETVWFDALISNVDRSPRNPNLLEWHGGLWLIDHGASLYFHHADEDFVPRAHEPFAPIRMHVLLPWASALREADARLRPLLTRELIEKTVAAVPLEWLPEERREAYVRYFEARREGADHFLEEAVRAHARSV